MPLALPVVAVGFLALVLALILTVLLTPVIEGLAREVPVVGGYIGRVIGRVVDWAVAKFTSYAHTFVQPVIGWLDGLREAVKDLAESAALFAVSTVEQLDHLTHVTVHEIVHAFVNPVRDLARSAQDDANALAGSLGLVYSEALEDFHGIEHGVDVRLDHLHDLVRNVDLPALGADLGEVIGQVERDAVGRIGDLRDQVVPELNRLRHDLSDLPLQHLLEAAAAATATAALVDVIARESGLGRDECRRKVKQICTTDPAGWEQLLAGIIPLFAFTSLRELVELGAGVARLLEQPIRALDGGG